MKNFVLITAIESFANDVRSRAYKYSIQSWKEWCRVNDCELRVLNTPFLSEEFPANFYRYWCFDLLDGEAYDQICLVDADTIVHPKCPNFFKLTDGKFCAVHNDGDYDWMIRSIENYQSCFPKELTCEFDMWKYFNSGFIVLNQRHKPLLDRFLNFINENITRLNSIHSRYGTGRDQPIINLMAQRLLSSEELKILPYQFNMQDLPRKNALNTVILEQIPGIYHFNAIPDGPFEANKCLESTYRYFYE